MQRAAFSHHARQMAKTLTMRALDSQILHGTYALRFRGFPRIPLPGRNRDAHIFDTAMDYINGTANSDDGEEIALLGEHSDQIALKKIDPNGASVAEILTHTEWEVESQEKIRDLIDLAAQTKINKLGKNGHSSGDAILVLYDAYAFVDFDSIVECAADLASLKAFAAVYWASAFADRENFTYPDQPVATAGSLRVAKRHGTAQTHCRQTRNNDVQVRTGSVLKTSG